MRISKRSNRSGWLAFGPAALALTVGVAAHASQTVEVYNKVSAAEAAMLQAISRHDTGLLRKTIAGLGPLIDDALKRKKAGGPVSSCDMAAHSLGFAGVNLSEAITQRGRERQALIDDARRAAQDFNRDMTACDAQAGRKAGNHTGVEKALRAL
ncbi:hypothetical protein NAC44_04885 [Allorhizobium sp. BGMRC 0089]|uniref:hypothetical protein n=1 Tax=Allorhizobium sonneratiae TaxID=2934936 RepID=UPI002033735F|nr:hypothetical protein [Allorhizobium sonneratiae]MCM2291662.1 hypothetical protein [Allorhizobium sonneratiae]